MPYPVFDRLRQQIKKPIKPKEVEKMVKQVGPYDNLPKFRKFMNTRNSKKPKQKNKDALKVDIFNAWDSTCSSG